MYAVLKADKKLFMSPDYRTMAHIRELGYMDSKIPYILDFKKLFTDTEVTSVMKEMLALLSKAYDYPVDIEFTANFNAEGKIKINPYQGNERNNSGSSGKER